MMTLFRDKDGQDKHAFTILTTAANESMVAFHDRMPAILAADEREEWVFSDSFMRMVLREKGRYWNGKSHGLTASRIASDEKKVYLIEGAQYRGKERVVRIRSL